MDINMSVLFPADFPADGLSRVSAVVLRNSEVEDFLFALDASDILWGGGNIPSGGAILHRLRYNEYFHIVFYNEPHGKRMYYECVRADNVEELLQRPRTYSLQDVLNEETFEPLCLDTVLNPEAWV